MVDSPRRDDDRDLDPERGNISAADAGGSGFDAWPNLAHEDLIAEAEFYVRHYAGSIPLLHDLRANVLREGSHLTIDQAKLVAAIKRGDVRRHGWNSLPSAVQTFDTWNGKLEKGRGAGGRPQPNRVGTKAPRQPSYVTIPPGSLTEQLFVDVLTELALAGSTTVGELHKALGGASRCPLETLQKRLQEWDRDGLLQRGNVRSGYRTSKDHVPKITVAILPLGQRVLGDLEPELREHQPGAADDLDPEAEAG